MAGFIFPTTNQLAAVTLMKTPYATGLLKLFKSAIPFVPTLLAADLAAIEADFSGYVAKTLVSLPAAYVDPVNGGVSFTIPTQQWNVASTPTVHNDIFGGWIEDAGGLLLMAWQIDSPYAMQLAGQSLPLELTLNFFGSNQVYVDIAGVPR